MPKLLYGSKGGFEPELSRLRVRHSAAVPHVLYLIRDDSCSAFIPISWYGTDSDSCCMDQVGLVQVYIQYSTSLVASCCMT